MQTNFGRRLNSWTKRNINTCLRFFTTTRRHLHCGSWKTFLLASLARINAITATLLWKRTKDTTTANYLQALAVATSRAAGMLCGTPESLLSGTTFKEARMPIIIDADSKVALDGIERGPAIKALLVAAVSLAEQELKAPPVTEADKIRHKFLAAAVYYINQEADRYLPEALEAEKTDKLKKLFEIP